MTEHFAAQRMSFLPRLWSVLETAAGDPDKLREQLADASAQQMIYLLERYVEAAADLRDVPEFWDHAAPGKAEHLARCIMNQGRDAWLAAQQDASQLPREPPATTMSIAPQLWSILAQVAGDAGVLRDIATRMTQEQLILLHRRFGIAAAQLRQDPRFLAHVGTVAGPLSEAIVIRGERAWREALQDPTSVSREDPRGRLDVPAVLGDVYQRRFGHSIPDQEPPPERDAGLRYDPAWERVLWDMIEAIDAGVPSSHMLAGFTRSELVQLDTAIRSVVGRYSPRFVEAFGDDPEGFDWSRWLEWSIAHGEEALERYLADPGNAPRAISPDALNLGSELFEEYRRRYDAPLPVIEIE